MFERLDSAPLGDAEPGQFVTVSLPDDAGVPPLQRCYSISTRPSGRRLRITVRRLGMGGFSDKLHATVRVGSPVQLRAPSGRFTLDRTSDRNIALISAGVGITPMLPMLEDAVSRGHPGEIYFIHGARDGASHAFKDDVKRFCAISAKVHQITAYSRPAPSDSRGLDYGVAGRIDTDLVASLVDLAATDFYICGPDEFMHTIAAGLAERGVPPGRIRLEAFSPVSGAASVSSDLPPRRVTFSKSKLETEWTPACGTLLDLAIANKLPASFSCKIGECQSCIQRVLVGAVSYPDDTDVTLDPGQVLRCLAVPTEDIVLDL